MADVYKILNTVNNKFYIGSSVNYKRRLREHRSMLNQKKHHCAYLQKAVNKYGIDNFVMVKVETDILPENLIETEQFYIDNLNPHYNMNPIAGNSYGFKHSEETKKKISLSRMGNKWGVGKVWSDESRQKIRDFRSVKINQYSLSGELLNTYSSIKEAAELSGVSIYYIKEYSNGKIINGGGFVWERVK